MANYKRLFEAHLEHVSWHVFDQYPQVVRDLIKGNSGVYALFKRNKLYYVGLARNLMSRLKQHLRDRHHGSWDRFSVYLTRDDRHMKELETLLIRISNPPGNRQSGNFAKSKNLKLVLGHEIKKADSDNRKRLLGAKTKRTKPSATKPGKKGPYPSAGLVQRRCALQAEYKGWVYSAALRKDGQIRFDGKLYPTPTSAAKVIVKRSINGWNFWKFRNANKDWVPLAKLRR